MTRQGGFRRRLHRALVVGGITIGILLLLFLQFAIPFWTGPLGLLAVVLLDLAICLELRRLRTLRRRAHTRFRKGDRVPTVLLNQDQGPLKEALAVAVVFVLFVVGLLIEGAGLGTDISSRGAGLGLLVVGIVLTSAAYYVLMLYGWESGIGALGFGYTDMRTESEKYDTTDDH